MLHSSLLGPVVSDDENEELRIQLQKSGGYLFVAESQTEINFVRVGLQSKVILRPTAVAQLVEHPAMYPRGREY